MLTRQYLHITKSAIWVIQRGMRRRPVAGLSGGLAVARLAPPGT
jgi:hypothetical protein